MPRAPGRHLSDFGRVLRYWRGLRGKSQLDLALDAEISPRHVSFLETGRAKPSRRMIHALAEELQVPLRERNTMLTAAGYAPFYRETALEAPELAVARQALGLLLRRHEPFPAVVLNRRWDVVDRNEAARRFFGRLAQAPDAASPGPLNVLRMMFHPRGLRPAVLNWEEVAGALVRRVHREAVGGVPDEETSRLLAEILSYPGVPSHWRAPDLESPLQPLVPVDFRDGDRTWRFFSTVTTLGTAQDVTLQELRVECFHPADPQTEALAAQEAGYELEETAARSS